MSDLDVYMCAAGSDSPPLTCQIRVDPDCSSSGTSCDSDADCPMEQRCLPNEEGTYPGTCDCRPCGLPPDPGWGDCPTP